MLVIFHEGIGHPGHRRILEGLAAAIACRLDPHQPRILPVLHVAAQHAILDQHIAPRLCALVIYGDRPAPVLNGAVIHDGHTF